MAALRGVFWLQPVHSSRNKNLTKMCKTTLESRFETRFLGLEIYTWGGEREIASMNNLDDRIRLRSRSTLRYIRPLQEQFALTDVLGGLQERIMGQTHAIDEIVPYVRMF